MKNKFLFLAMLLPGLAQSQVILEQTQAESGSYYKGVLTVTQGCNGSATTAITVDIPEGLQFAQPMPKLGWQLEIVKKPLERPFFKDGIEITEAVRQITWSGNTLHDIHFDEFIFRGRIGVGATSVLYFPVSQTCESGEMLWDQLAENNLAEKDFRESPPDGVIDMLEDMEEIGDEPAMEEAGHSADHSQPKAHQHPYDHQMKMTEDKVETDHSIHAGHGPSTLQYPAPFVRVVDGTGEHHQH